MIRKSLFEDHFFYESSNYFITNVYSAKGFKYKFVKLSDRHVHTIHSKHDFY